MAGHSKWHNIRHRKMQQDAKKSKIYTKISKLIQIAAKKWSNPETNPSLALALDKAKEYWVPKEIIERALKKASWEIQEENLEEILYEAYWPWWVWYLIKCITSNKNRTANNIKIILMKYWWSLWEPWSVSWQFEEKWEIIIEWKIEKKYDKNKEIIEVKKLNNEDIENLFLINWIEDINQDEYIQLITTKEAFSDIKKYLEDNWFKIQEANLIFWSKNKIDLTNEILEKNMSLIQALEEDDDVDSVYVNF